ncbi:hypothetical protein GQ600_9194 [Phytophthora cactorum]|nr:hypothetical protein GQ600_9194 [Phytophthora cactorum]
MVEEDGTVYFVFRKVHPVKVPRDEFLVIGRVLGCRVEPCVERKCTGPFHCLTGTLEALSSLV